MRKEILFIFFACISLTLNQGEDDMMEGVDEENIEEEDLEVFEDDDRIRISFEPEGGESSDAIAKCEIKHPNGETHPVDQNLDIDGRITCQGQCKRAPGGPNEDKGPRTKCGVLLNPIDVTKDAGEWTIRVDYKDKDGQKVNPRIKMVKVKLTAKKRPTTTTEAPTTTTEATTTPAAPQCERPRRTLGGRCRCPRWRKGQRFHEGSGRCRCTGGRRWNREDRNCECRDADSVWNRDDERCEAAPTVAPESTTAEPGLPPELGEECFRDNTAYYGHNINNPATTRTRNTIECQQRCQDWTGGGRCRFWSFDKEFGRCYIKRSMEGQEYAIAAYGEVFVGNNDKYASGSRECPTVRNIRVGNRKH